MNTDKIGRKPFGVSTEEDEDVVGPLPEDDDEDDDHTKAKLE